MPLVNNKEELKRYDEFIRNSVHAKPMQDINRSKVKDNRSYDFIYLEENKKIIAAMSVIGIDNSNGKYFLYAPRGPVVDFKNIDLVKKLIEEADILKEKYDPFLLRMDPEVTFDEKLIYDYKKLGYDFRSFGEKPKSFTQPRHNMIIDLNVNDKDQLLKSFSTSTRRNIKKSYREDIYTIHKTDEQSLNIFYELTEIMAKRQNIGHRPKDYFKRLIEYMGASIFTSYYKDIPLSSSIIISYNDKMYYLYAASSNEHRNKMPNYNMIWEEIKYAMDNGYRYLDLGGTFSLDSEDGLYYFKEGFCYPDKYTSFIGELDVVYDREKYNEFINQKDS